MDSKNQYLAIGLMSGTSVDGIDAALLLTDGESMVKPLGFTSLPFDPDLRLEILGYMGSREDTGSKIARAEKELTLAHADAVRELLNVTDTKAEDIDIIGFHGQTITHVPVKRFTWQLGDGRLLARELGINVINDFRSQDVKSGGQGAPLLPLYHRALVMAGGHELPCAVLNIGGVANVTWIGGLQEHNILSFDTGPGNALINDFVSKRKQMYYDSDGLLAASGTINQDLLMKWLSHPYFSMRPPKSLDRNTFDVSDTSMLADAEGAATLTAFTVFSARKSFEFLPVPPKELFICGGGRHNMVMMAGLNRVLDLPVCPVEEIGWNGDATEAEGFAYLAVRSLLGLPVSMPQTTGVPEPLTGGTLHKANA